MQRWARTEAEDIKKRWQEYTEELYKKDLHDPDNHNGVITHLEPDILECEVKWALGSITMNKASGGDGIPVELFQILKDDAVKELYKKDLHDQDNHDGVITHQEPDILECEVKWALESIATNKASGGDGIPVELFQILKDDAVKVLHSICQQIWENSAVATGLEKVSFHSNPKERQCQRMLKLPHNCTHLTC